MARKRKFKKVGKVAVRAHVRTPRGRNAGKPNQKVKGYTRDSGWAKRKRRYGRSGNK